MSAVFLLMAVLFGAEPAVALECGAVQTSAGTAQYCVRQFDAAKNPDIFYYMNGALPDGADDSFATAGQYFVDSLVDLWRTERLAPPTMVTISWGARWLLRGKRLVALERELIPAIEAKLAIKGGDRLIGGQSLGGLNAYLAWSRLPHLFARAAFLCPAFFSFNPITDPESRREIAERMSAKDWQWWRPWRYRASLKLHLDAVNTLAWAFEKDVTAGDDWSQFDPARVVKDGAERPPAYVVFNSMDQHPFSPGYELAQAGYRVTYETVVDNHCNRVSTIGLARFLARRS